MAKEWQELTKLTQGAALTVEKVRLADSGIAIEGAFDLPPLARLTMEDQYFVAAFVKCHGSIKEMEQIFGVSYPTIKSRLNRLAEQLDFVKIEMAEPKNEVLSRLNQGEISVKEALQLLQESRNEVAKEDKNE